VSYRFTPSAAGTRTATLSVSATGISRIDVPFSGLGQFAALALNPTSVDFGPVAIGTSATRDITVSNPGQLTTTGTLSRTVTGMDLTEGAVANACGSTLAGGASCMVRVRYAPSAHAATNGTLVVQTTPLDAVTTTLAGSGVNPASLQFDMFAGPFPQTVVGTPVTKAYTLRNAGEAPAAVPTFSIIGPGAMEFSVLTDGCTSPLPPNGSCQMTMSFRAMTAGPFAALLRATADPGGTTDVSMDALAIRPATLSLTNLQFPTMQPPVLTFADTAVGSVDPTTRTFNLVNTGEVATGPVSSPAVGQQLGGGFSVAVENCSGRVLMPLGGSCPIDIRFAPTGTPGPRSATLMVQVTPGGMVTGSMVGNALP
jgi:hypothetical protein